MVYKITLLFLLLLFSTTAWNQVGIGTEYPQADLHVAGEMLVQEIFKIQPLPIVNLADKDFKLLTRVSNSSPAGEITVLNVDSLTVAPINVIDYTFTNISKDNLRDVNLQYDANKYVVGVANFRYVGDAIKKSPFSNGNSASIGTFVIRTFISNGQWHLEIRNRILDLNDGDSLEYFVTLIVYDKSYYRNLPPIITNLGGLNTGTASSVPDIY